MDHQTGNLTPPPFHQLEWAGFVTSMCRSMVYRAAIDDLSSVIAYETDALFTTRPCDVPIGSALGEWEGTSFRDLTYVQSGLYFGTLDDGATVSKTRGVNLGSLTREQVEQRMQLPADERYATAELTQFITAGLAIQGRWHDWRHWVTTVKQIQLEPQGKRVALPGEFGKWNLTFAARVPRDCHSAEFPVMWINPNLGMDELDELRNLGRFDFDLLDDWG